jgi:hypothetical protein
MALVDALAWMGGECRQPRNTLHPRLSPERREFGQCGRWWCAIRAAGTKSLPVVGPGITPTGPFDNARRQDPTRRTILKLANVRSLR